MNESARPTTARERDRALRRLQSITTGTAVMATMATAGFGTLAAFTWSGTTGDAATDTTTDTTTINSTVAQLDPDDDGDPGADATIGGSTAAPSASAAPLQPAPTPTPTRKKSRVTSGGSG